MPNEPARAWGRLKEVDWNEEARNVLKGALKRGGVSYADLREKLANMGIEETEANLRNKVNRGKFSAAFFLQCCAAMGTDQIWLGKMYVREIPEIEF